MSTLNHDTWEQYLANLEDSFTANQFFLNELQKRQGTDSDSQPAEEEGELAIDIYKEPDKIIVAALIAGASTKNLIVNFHNGILTIHGERQQPPIAHSGSALHRECYWGKFSRSIVLPETIATDKLEAILKNGLLIIILPILTHATGQIQIKEIEE